MSYKPIVGLVAVCVSAFASTVVIQDEFHTTHCTGAPCYTPAPGPDYRSPAPSDPYDVYGTYSDFDLEKIVFNINAGGIAIDLYTNWHNNSFSPWNLGNTLNAADLIFGTPGAFTYGVALTTHGNVPNGGPSGDTLTAGHIYRIEDQRGVLQSIDVYRGSCKTCYRPWAFVWLFDPRGSSQTYLTDIGSGSIARDTTYLGNGVTGSEYKWTFSIAANSPGYAEFLNGIRNNQVNWASATCGNDILTGLVVPEPSTYLVLLGGFSLTAVVVRRARRLRNAPIFESTSTYESAPDA